MKFLVVASFKKDETRYSEGETLELSTKEYRDLRGLIRPLEMDREPYPEKRRNIKHGESLLKLTRPVLKKIRRESLARAIESQLNIPMRDIRMISQPELVEIVVKYRGY